MAATNTSWPKDPKVYHEAYGYAPLDSEIFALIDSIGASYTVQDGIVTVRLNNGDVWDFTIPMRQS